MALYFYPVLTKKYCKNYDAIFRKKAKAVKPAEIIKPTTDIPLNQDTT